jgi:serine protease
MKKVLVSLVVVVVLLTVFAQVKSAEPLFVKGDVAISQPDIVPNEFIVGFKEGVNTQAKSKALENVGQGKLKRLGLKNFEFLNYQTEKLSIP